MVRQLTARASPVPGAKEYRPWRQPGANLIHFIYPCRSAKTSSYLAVRVNLGFPKKNKTTTNNTKHFKRKQYKNSGQNKRDKTYTNTQLD